MARIIVIGAGVMGSAICAPAADNGHQVMLVGTHLDNHIIDALKRSRAAHPTLNAALPDAVIPLFDCELDAAHVAAADIVIVGVSSPGAPWIIDRLRPLLDRPMPVLMVTKGLCADRSSLGVLPPKLAAGLDAPAPVIGVGGPCIAKELADRKPTTVLFCGDDAAAMGAARRLLATPYYRIDITDDVIGVEACAALKNLLTIGVSAMWTRHPEISPSARKPRAMNASAALFCQAVQEMARLTRWLGGDPETAYGRAGVGDLNVTVGGGRNSLLGLELGAGSTIAEAMAGPLSGLTVEGVDTGRQLAAPLDAAFQSGALNADDLPLTRALVNAIATDQPFDFDFTVL